MKRGRDVAEWRTERIPAASGEVFSFLPFLPSTTQRRKQSTTHKVCVVVVSGRWLGEEEVVVVVEEEEEEEEEEAGGLEFLCCSQTDTVADRGERILRKTEKDAL